MKHENNETDENQHCIELIREDLSLLDAKQMMHIDRCSKCKTEYEIYQRLERAIATLPLQIMPDKVRQQILAEVLKPSYSLKQLLADILIAGISPVILSITNLKAFFAPGLVAGIYGGSGILVLLLLIPLAHYLITRYRLDVDSLKMKIDQLLEKRAHL